MIDAKASPAQVDGWTRRRGATIVSTQNGEMCLAVCMTQRTYRCRQVFGQVAGIDDVNKRRALTHAWPGGAQASLLPFHMIIHKGEAECAYDLSHFWPAGHTWWDNYFGPDVNGGPTSGPSPNDFAADVMNNTLHQVSWMTRGNSKRR